MFVSLNLGQWKNSNGAKNVHDIFGSEKGT
jgi:hypothetical protein